MKKFFTLVAMATMALVANAQTEVGFFNPTTDPNGINDAEATPIAAGTEFVKTANVTWHCEGDQSYKLIAMCAEADQYNTVTIDGVKYSMPSGIQAQDGNGKDVNADHTAPASIGGSEQYFTCRGTGYLFVFSKTSYNKKYYVYDGDIASSAGNCVAYTHFLAPITEGQAITSYTLPADELGYVVWPDEYPSGCFLSNKSYNQVSAIPGCEHITANSLGVIAFPVWGSTEYPMDYVVFASGSKITTNGFVFIPNDSPSLENIPAITFTKEATGTGIQNVEAVENAKTAPVKVIKNGQIMIGDFNIAGQRVK